MSKIKKIVEPKKFLKNQNIKKAEKTDKKQVWRSLRTNFWYLR